MNGFFVKYELIQMKIEKWKRFFFHIVEYFGKLDSLNVLQDPYISVHLKFCKSLHETLHCKLNVYQGIYNGCWHNAECN